MTMDRHKTIIDYSERHTYDNTKITIEEQLHLYEKHPGSNERNAVLWHAWQQNKRWLIQLLELTIASFPAYSRHNASHAKAVLYNIERILGEERIKRLEPTDCFALLHVVYIHDIGMAILADDREEMVASDEFAEMVDELTQDADYDLKRAAMDLQRISYRRNKDGGLIDRGGEEYLSEQKAVYREKFNTYYAIIQLMAEFQRGKHGERAGSRISSWITDQDKLRSEFAMSGIPMRIFLRIADCASLHTDWDFRHILDLPFEENGYEHDMLHPRFVAVLLQLGDALDIDNDRFHPFAHAFLGKLPMQSQAHYDKHMAIRSLKVTPEKICVEADCISREAMRLVKKECAALERLLKMTSYHWSSIAPRGLGGALPTLKIPRLLLKGREIPTDLAMMPFRISQKEAFSLLQGEKRYSVNFPFVRELLQNAIDTTKIQCWMDYINSPQFRYKKDNSEQSPPSLLNVAQIVNPIEYPIEIEIKSGRKNDKNEWEEIEFGSIKSIGEKEEEFGIILTFRDYGTGISTEVLRDISEVGTSYRKRKKRVRNIPEWLRPIGEFGIGLQSVFLVSDRFFCETYTRNGERYKVEFGMGMNGENGYISAEPRDVEIDKMPFGTEFSVFISHDTQMGKEKFNEELYGYDPFGEKHGYDKIKRNILELTTAMLLDMDKQLGELLFPIYVHLEFPVEDLYKTGLNNKLKKIIFDTSLDFCEHTEKTLKKRLSWIYNFNEGKDDSFQKFEITDGICAYDFEQMKVYMWLEDISTCVRLGVERLIESFLNNKKLCQIFFKGMLAEEVEVAGDMELLELIDIKGGKMDNNFLRFNRNGFTNKGMEHIEKVIVPKVLKRATEALGIIAREAQGNIKTNDGEYRGGFEKLIGRYFNKELKINLIEKKKGRIDWQGKLLGISLFYCFYMINSKENQGEYVSNQLLSEREKWGKTLETVKDILKKYSKEIEESREQNIVVNMSVPIVGVAGACNYVSHGEEQISVADIFDFSNHFLLISKRLDENDSGLNFFVRLIEKDVSEEEIRKYIAKAENNIKNLSCSIRSMIRFRATTRNEIIQKRIWLETWGQCIKENITSSMKKISVEQSSFIRKIVKYMPIIGCFSNSAGELRIYVIGEDVYKEVFYDNNLKYTYMKKMVEKKSLINVERFAVLPHFEFRVLGIEKYPKGIYSIQDDYILNKGYQVIFPCSGTSLKELFDKYENLHVKTDLRLIGEELKKICNFEYNYYEISNEGLSSIFDEKRAEYSTSQRKPCKVEQFLRVLKMNYNILLNQLLKKIIDEYNTKKKLEMYELPAYEEIRENSRLICEAVINNFEYVVGEKGKVEPAFKEYFYKLIKCVITWNKKYKAQLEEEVRNCFENIYKRYWQGSKERERLIDWVVRYSFYGRDLISEMYEQLWLDIQEVMIKTKIKNEVIFENWDVLQCIIGDDDEKCY